MKKLVCTFLILFLTVQNAVALVMDGNSPFYGDYLFVYNPTTSNQMMEPFVTADELTLMSAIESDTEIPENTITVETDENGQVRYRVHQERQKNKDLPKPELYGIREILPEDEISLFSTGSTPQLGDTITYLVYDYSGTTAVQYAKGFFYAHSGSYCNILIETDEEGNPVLSSADAEKLATEFDTNIQPFMVENFGDYYTYLGVSNGYLQYSKNTKIDLLLYDIQDGFDYETNRSYTAGITDLFDFISEDIGGNGNERAILHIDTYPLMGLDKTAPSVEKAYSTVVHEFQHQISCSDSVFSYFAGKTTYYQNEVWWNEAFSMAAEHMYTGQPLTYRLSSYNAATDSTPLRNGLVLNYANYSQNHNHTASNYSTAYLFGQYLRTQTKCLTGGGNQIFKTVLNQDYYDYRAILKGLAAIGYPYLPSDFPTLYRNFRMATILKYPTGPYGFAGESAFNGLKDNAYTGTATVTLKPRAGIVLKTPKNFVPPEDSKLKYIAFSHRGIYTYELNPADGYTVNITHGYLPQCGATLWVAGYNAEGQLLGVDDISITADTENYTYTLPAETVIKKFFLWAADDNQKPLAVSVTE